MIEFKNVTKSFNEKNKALDNISFKIPNNSIYGLIGANGSGKSTLLRLTSNVIKADKGEIIIDCQSSYDNEKIKKEVFFLPDDLYFPHNYSLLDTAKFYKKLYDKFDMIFLKNEAQKLKLDLNKNINKLSKGMKRQLALLLALSCNTKYILLDEAFDGLDPVIRKHFKDLLIKQVSKNNTSVILSSHSLKELEDICDNIALLYNGTFILNGEVDSLKSQFIKVQLAFKKDANKDYFKKLDYLFLKKSGNVITIIMNDTKDNREIIEKSKPTLVDYLPLSLEEIFIYKMEELGYEFN